MARSKVTPESRLELLQRNAQARGKEFTITLENMQKLLAETHCQYTGVPFDNEDGQLHLSIERINNELGYVPGNVVPVTKVANGIKSDFQLETLKKRNLHFAKRRIGAVKSNTDKVNAALRKVKNHDDQIARILESKKRAEEVLAIVQDELARSQVNLAEDEFVAEMSGKIYDAIVSNPYMGWKYLTLNQKLKFAVAKLSPKLLFAKLKRKD